MLENENIEFKEMYTEKNYNLVFPNQSLFFYIMVLIKVPR